MLPYRNLKLIQQDHPYQGNPLVNRPSVLLFAVMGQLPLAKSTTIKQVLNS